MPVERRKAPPSHSHPDLVDLLCKEILSDSTKRGPGIPEVIEEEQAPGGSLHVTVFWDRWSEVPTEERGAIILDAYEKAGEKDTLRHITMVLGLTAEEADRLGIER